METTHVARALQRGSSDAAAAAYTPIGGGTTGRRASESLARRSGHHGSHPTKSGSSLHTVLMVGDGVVMFVGYAVPLLAFADRRADSFGYGLLCAAVITFAGLWSMRFQGLWQDRVTSVRAIEVSKIARALVMVSLVALVLDRKSPVDLRVPRLIAAMAIGWIVIVMWRSAYRAYVAAARKQGLWTKRVILIGTDRRGVDLKRLFEVHPELGMRITAVVGRRHEAEMAGLGDLWRADYIDAGVVVAQIDADAVIISSADIDPILAANLTRNEHARHRSVFVDPGLSGFDMRRLRATHIAHQPLLEVETMSLETLQHSVKRAFDIAVAGLIAVLAAPAMVIIALLIKAEDRGPVLFRQKRVGHHGREFGILKFRTMVPNAEKLITDLEADNQRSGGKAADRIGDW